MRNGERGEIGAMCCSYEAYFFNGALFKIGLRYVLAQPICDKIWQNCAFYDTSMTFGTHLDFIIVEIVGYRAISDFVPQGDGGHFPRW